MNLGHKSVVHPNAKTQKSGGGTAPAFLSSRTYMLKMERFFILYLLQMSIAWTR